MNDIPVYPINPESRNVGNYQQVTSCSELTRGMLNSEQWREHSELPPMFRDTKQLGILCNIVYSSMLPRFRVIPPTRARGEQSRPTRI